MTSIPLDIMGRHRDLRKMYTNICYVFSLPHLDYQTDVPDELSFIDVVYSRDEVDRVQRTLRKGLEKLSVAFPWLAGQVREGIEAFQPTIQLQTGVRPDLSMNTLRDAKWSMQGLDPATYVPCALVARRSSDLPDTMPVLMVKAVFIAEGVVLTFSANHAAMDATGQAAVIALFNKACSGAEFTAEDLQQGRRSVLHPSRWRRTDTDEDLEAEIKLNLDRAPALTDLTLPLPLLPPRLVWAYFQADLASLKLLKKKALESTPGFVSTDDALTALVWQSITRARGLNPSIKSALTRDVDMRRIMRLPDTYPGLMQNMAISMALAGDLTASSLGRLAADLHSKLAPETLERDMKAVMTLMSTRPQVSPTTRYLRSCHDVLLTSWIKMECYNNGFGLELGKPEAVMMPRLPPKGEGWVNFMPKCRDKGVIFGVCLQERDMQALKGDGPFAEYVQCLD